MSEDSFEDGQVERYLVVSVEEFPLVGVEENPLVASEGWKTILLSSEDDRSSQHYTEGDVDEACEVGEEMANTVGDDQLPEVPDNKRKSVEEKHPSFHIQEVRVLSLDIFTYSLLNLHVLQGS